MREHRYYMRVFERASTRYWGIALAVGLQLPATAPPPPTAGNPVPAAATAPAPPFVPAWTIALDGTSSDGLAASRDAIIVLSRDGDAQSVMDTRATATGNRIWTSSTRGWQTIAAQDDTVVGVASGRLEALDAATGRTRWWHDLPGDTPRLTLADEWLVATTSATVSAFGVRQGGRAWQHALAAPASSAASLDPTAVTVGLADATLSSYALATGDLRWRVPTGSPVLALASDPARVYGGLANGTLCAWRATDGRTAWCRTLGIPVAGRPLVTDAYLLVVLRDNTLRVFDRASGTLRQQRALGFRPASGVEVSGERLIIALASAAFHVMSRDTRAIANVLPASSATAQLFGTVVGRDGQVLVSLTIPAGGTLTLTAYRPSAPPAPASPSAASAPTPPSPR